MKPIDKESKITMHCERTDAKSNTWKITGTTTVSGEVLKHSVTLQGIAKVKEAIDEINKSLGVQVLPIGNQESLSNKEPK